MRKHSAHARDAALRRLARANRWLIAGSVALTAVLTEVAAQAFPGKTLHGASASGTSSRTHSKSSTGTSSNMVELHPPSQNPGSTSRQESGQSTASGESSSQESAQSSESRSGSESTQSQETAGQSSESSAPVVSGGS
jgi:hypothetical protein